MDEFKAKVALAALRGELTTVWLVATKHAVRQTTAGTGSGRRWLG